MIFIGILLSIAAIGFLCGLLFTLAVFALPFFAGVTAGTWAYGTGAGWLGAIVVGLVAAGLTFGIGQFLLATVRPTWARLLIAAAFVAPAVVAGFHATHGIVKHTMPSETWQTVFSVIGAIAVGIVAFVRITGMATSGPSAGHVPTPKPAAPIAARSSGTCLRPPRHLVARWGSGIAKDRLRPPVTERWSASGRQRHRGRQILSVEAFRQSWRNGEMRSAGLFEGGLRL